MWTIDPAIGLGVAVAVVAFFLFYYLRALHEPERERDHLLAQRQKRIRRLAKRSSMKKDIKNLHLRRRPIPIFIKPQPAG